jgi:hypothetical protein
MALALPVIMHPGARPPARWLVSAVLLLALSQNAVAQSEHKSAAIAHAKALQAAATDMERESINASMKLALRKVLDADDGLSVNLDDLPLSRVEAPDGSFRLITWNLPKADGSYAYEGLLLARSSKLTSLYELRDMTAGINNPELAELGPEKWYGALYYQVMPIKKGGKTMYTLLGWKGHSAVETRKVIEVLSFRGGKPRFGAPLFGKGKLKEHRRVFGFAAQASMMLHADPERGRIVLDHLSPLHADMAGKGALMGPDMSFDAFVWDKGQWRYERDIDLRDPSRDSKPFKAPPAPPRP